MFGGMSKPGTRSALLVESSGWAQPGTSQARDHVLRRAIFLVAVVAAVAACGSDDSSLTGAGGSAAGGGNVGGAGGVGGVGGAATGTPTGTPAGTPAGTATGSTEGLPCAPAAVWEMAWETLETNLIDLVNQRRQMGGTCGSQTFGSLPTLAVDPLLRDVARAHAEHMSVEDYVGFSAPDGGNWLSQVGACGGTFVAGASTKGQTTAQAMFDAIIQDEPTCQGLHGPGTVIGVGHHSANATPSWALYVGQP
jgi:uncharacterized protein YkwD